MSWQDDFEQVPVAVTTPNGKVTAELRGTTWADVRFAPGFYEQATTPEMAEQLTRAVRLLQAERTRAWYAGLSRARGESVRPASGAGLGRTADYLRRLEELAAEGSSPGGEVTLVGVGLRSFHVSVAPGVLDALGEAEFAEACRSAGTAFLTDHLAKVAVLQFDVYYRADLEAAGLSAGGAR